MNFLDEKPLFSRVWNSEDLKCLTEKNGFFDLAEYSLLKFLKHVTFEIFFYFSQTLPHISFVQVPK